MRQSLLDRIVRFAAESDAVTALILVGSQARTEIPADEYSDTDLLLIASDADLFTRSDAWLREIGDVHISFTEPTIDGQIERRVLFDGAQDVDFVIMLQEAATRALETGDAAFILSRGYRVLVDKAGLGIPPLPPPAPFKAATEAEFTNTVNDFWYHTVWTAKKLLRKELWTAKFCVDSYMKWKLLWMIEQHAHAISGKPVNTWYGGRFIERWAREDILRDLEHCFAHYEQADMAKALLATMALFRRLAAETAQAAGFPYPAQADAYATEWVQSRLEPLLQAEPAGGDGQ